MVILEVKDISTSIWRGSDNMNGCAIWIGSSVAAYINGLDAGFTLIDNGGGIRTVGYDRDLSDDAAMSVGIWSNEEGFEDQAPRSLSEQSQVIVQCYNHADDIWVCDTLYTGTALECINWLVAESPSRVDDAESHYAPILKLAEIAGQSRNMSAGE